MNTQNTIGNRSRHLRRLSRNSWKWIFRIAMLSSIATAGLTLVLVLRLK